MRILDMGCGIKKFNSSSDTVIGIDFSKNSDADVIHDLNKFPYPFNDSEFDVVTCSHIIEHLPNTVNVLQELWRVSKNGAIIKIWVPYFTFAGAFADITHVRYFSYNSFNHLDSPMWDHKQNNFSLKLIKKRLLFSKYHRFVGFEHFINAMPRVYEATGLCHIFPAQMVYFELEVVKNMTESGKKFDVVAAEKIGR